MERAEDGVGRGQAADQLVVLLLEGAGAAVESMERLGQDALALGEAGGELGEGGGGQLGA